MSTDTLAKWYTNQLVVTQLYVGGPRSGSPVHFHNDATNYLVYGAKLWTLLPPPAAVYSRRHAAVDVGLGRIAALYYCSSTLCRNR
jgi:hypothetical protein